MFFKRPRQDQELTDEAIEHRQSGGSETGKSAVGVIPDSSKTVSLDAKLPGDLLYILGSTDDELAGSEFLRLSFPASPGKERKSVGRASSHTSAIPKVNGTKNLRLYKSLFSGIQNNLVASAISISSGGLIVALLKKLMGGGLGAEVDLMNLPGDWKENYQALFSESQGRILVSVDPKKSAAFEKAMGNSVFAKIGKTAAGPFLTIADKSQKSIVKLKIVDALKAYKSTFNGF